MGKASAKMEVTDYRMSIHYGICHQADELQAIYVGEKSAWEGSAVENTKISVNAPNLFGGPKKEGGVSGIAEWLPGVPTQSLPSYLASKLGLTPTTAPGYRGISSIWFYGSGVFNPFNAIFDLPTGGAGFYWATNNPYLRSIWMKIRRSPKALATGLRTIKTGGFTASTNQNAVTINGVTATVTQGVAVSVNGHSVLLDGNSLTIDGLPVSVDFDGDQNVDSITIDSAEYDINLGDPLVAGDNRALVSVTSTYTVDSVHYANLNVTLAGTADANPSAIIYECLANTDWGMGCAPSMIDSASFTLAAQQLALEGFGLSLQWTKASDIESFVSEILDHVQATLFVNPRNGLFTIKLIRGDYDPDTLPVLTPDNCHITSFDRKAWGDTTNEIVVTWTNPTNEQEETVVAQDLANIVIQGAIISDSRNYYGVRSADLAMSLAKRDLASASTPTAVFEIEVDRSAWDSVPGGCAKLIYPEYGIDGLIVRVAKVDYGKAGSPTIKLSASEDIFSLPQGDYADPTSTAWVSPSKSPTPLDRVRIITAPGFFVSSTLTAADADALVYPDVMAAVLASSSNDDTSSYELYGQNTEANGEVVADSKGVKPLLGFSTLLTALPAEGTTLVESIGAITGGAGPRPGGFLFIGDVAEAAQEIALIQSIDETGMLLKRGVLDTVPRAWAVDTPVWFASIDSNFLDANTTHSDAETVIYKLLPSTSLGQVSLDDAAPYGAVMTGRPHLPNRPANVTVGGVAFGTVDLSAGSPTTVAVTWATRNRTMEDAQVLGWTDGSIPPETGQTTLIRLLSAAGDVITEHSGLTGTSFSIPAASFGAEAIADVRVLAERDGLESLMGHTIRVKLRSFGYGDDYGDNYGSTISDGSDPGEPDPGDPGEGDPGGSYTPPPDYTFPPSVPWKPGSGPRVVLQ